MSNHQQKRGCSLCPNEMLLMAGEDFHSLFLGKNVRLND